MGVYLDIVKYLVGEKGVNIKVKDRWGNTPLSEAKKADNTEIINFLNTTQALIMLQNKIRARIIKRRLLVSNDGL